MDTEKPMNPPPLVTKNILSQDLRNLGAAARQVVMLHASVKAVGWVVSGPDVVLQAITDILTPDGALLMLVGWEDKTYKMTDWPEEKQKAYLEECPPLRSQAISCIPTVEHSNRVSSHVAGRASQCQPRRIIRCRWLPCGMAHTGPFPAVWIGTRFTTG